MKVCVSILFFSDSGLDDNGIIIGEGNNPPFNMLKD
jgi:hypothetical protein